MIYLALLVELRGLEDDDGSMSVCFWTQNASDERSAIYDRLGAESIFSQGSL